MKLYKVERNILNWIVYHPTILLIIAAIGIFVVNTAILVKDIVTFDPHSFKKYFDNVKEDYSEFPKYQVEYAQDRREWLENGKTA